MNRIRILILAWLVLAGPTWAIQDNYFTLSPAQVCSATSNTTTTTYLAVAEEVGWATWMEFQFSLPVPSGKTDEAVVFHPAVESSIDGVNWDTVTTFLPAANTSDASRERKSVARGATIRFGRWIRVKYAAKTTTATLTLNPTMFIGMGR